MRAIVKFKKSNPDSEVLSYKVHRSSNQSDLFNAANVIATITNFAGNDTITYSDTTAKFETVYYYGLQTVGKDGYSTLSAPLYVNVQKSTGGISKDIAVGNEKLGFVQSSNMGAWVLINRARAQMVSDAIEAGPELAPAAVINLGSIPAASYGCVEAYYEGTPGYYFPGGLATFVNVTGATAISILAIRKIFDKLKAKLPVITFEGYEYEPRPIGKAEFEALFRGTVRGNIDAIINNRPQPVVPLLFDNQILTSTSENIALMSEDTGVLDIYIYNNTVFAGAKQAETLVTTNVVLPLVFTVKKN